MNWIMFSWGPIQTRLEAFLGFLVKTKMKAYRKLMCCQIVARKSVAPSSGYFQRRPAPRYACGQDQEFWKKTSFSKIVITPLLRQRPDLRECVTSMIFQELLVFFLLGGGVPNWKSHSDFFFQQIFFSKTSWWLVINRYMFRLVKRYYCDFFYK